VLELQSIKRHFGALKVIDGIDLSVAQGEVLGILGPNGAGKSTLFNLISGNLAPTSGTVLFEGKDIGSKKPWTRVRDGIGRSFQIPKPFVHLSVFENILVSAAHGARLPLRQAREEAAKAMYLTQLGDSADVLAGDLSLLDLKRLELAKALATQPRLLLLDEIAGGLTESECSELLEIIRLVHDQGVTVVWIEHVLHALMQVATRLAVIAQGGLITTGQPQNVLENKRVQELYLGAAE
jgi:branched-chain amino acid transport system ATP-binding protein